MGVNVSFRDVDEIAFRNFKATIARAGVKAGEAVSEALQWYATKREQMHKKPKFKLWKPTDWGPGTEKDSSRVDEFVYGWKR